MSTQGNAAQSAASATLGGIARTSGYGDTSIEQNSYHPPAEMAGGAGYNQGFGIRRHDL